MLNETHIGEIWMLFVDYLDKKQIEAIAERYIEYLVDNGVRDKTLQHAIGIESALDSAINYYLVETQDDGDSGDDDGDEGYSALEF